MWKKGEMSDQCPPNVCRACLSDDGNFQSIFVSNEKTGFDLHLSEMMMAFASVQVTLGDGLPEQICATCSEDIVKLYLFKLKCEESDKILRNKLGKSPLQTNDSRVIKEKPTSELRGVDVDIYKVVIKPEFNSEDLDRSNGFGDFYDDDKNDSNDEDSKSHYYAENGDKISLKCKQCSKMFENQIDFDYHVKTHTIEKAYKCTICDKAFSRNDLLLRHKIAHAMKMRDKSFDFEDLNNSFHKNSDDEDENEMETVVIKSESTLYTCPQCNLLFVKKEEHEHHLKERHKSKDGKTCATCGKNFSKQAHLNRHLKIHSQKRPYMCKTCNKSFMRSEQLNNHMNIHSGIKPHVCAICLKGFNQISNLKDHMRTHNGEKPFLCSTCGKGFNQLGNLRQHTIRHSGIKAHLCSTCGSGFASKGELSAHLRKHTGARPFVCPVCNHGFTTSSSLTKHKRIHSGEKPYECDVCKMKFSRSGILARHKRTHTGEKPYVCKFCSKAFSQSNDLTSHLRIHTGEKPYICDACGQAFRQSSALKTHKKTHIDKTSVTLRHIDKTSVALSTIVDIKPVNLIGTVMPTAFLA